jgi:ABC-type multidrug transport system ATPase subunit
VTTPLSATGIVKRYGARVVLPGIDVEVAPGEIVLLRGPNGTGKSTLVGCICGTVIPDEGTVAIGGHDLKTAPLSARAALRYLPQEVDIPAGLTGREWLQFHADVFADRTPLDGVIDAPLAEVIEQLATTYSVGLRRRLAFAGLMLGDADLFVLDEPLAGVDADGRARMLASLRERLGNGAGLLVAAHDHETGELAQLGPRVLDLRPTEASR